MLFDYLAEKHNVSWPDLLTSHFYAAFPMALAWTYCCFRVEVGGQAEQGNVELLPKTLNSFFGFVWLAQILRTFTFCGELLRINKVVQDSWIEPQECWRFYIYRDVWLLVLSIGPLPIRYPLTCPLYSVFLHTQPRPSAPQPAVGKAWAAQWTVWLSLLGWVPANVLNLQWSQWYWTEGRPDKHRKSSRTTNWF